MSPGNNENGKNQTDITKGEPNGYPVKSNTMKSSSIKDSKINIVEEENEGDEDEEGGEEAPEEEGGEEGIEEGREEQEEGIEEGREEQEEGQEEESEDEQGSEEQDQVSRLKPNTKGANNNNTNEGSGGRKIVPSPLTTEENLMTPNRQRNDKS